MKEKIFSLLLLVLVVASFFHVQSVVGFIAFIIIAMPLKKHFTALKVVRVFIVLLIPVAFGMFAGFSNDTYLIFKDLYYFLLPVLFILSGIILACRLQIDDFLKTIVYAGLIISVLVTSISVYYVGFSSIIDPYSAHYAMGIVGAPGPPLALGILLLARKFNITLFSRSRFYLFVAINIFGVYMCASRTYLIITLCFIFLLAIDKIKWKWIISATFLIVIIAFLLPENIFKPTATSTSFVDKILGSFNEISIGNYNTEEEINTKYRGYESFMAITQFLNGSTKDWIFGGLGKMVDLKTFLRLGADTEYEFIPVLHNGWLYLLIKTGALGVITYMIVFLRSIFLSWREYSNAKGRPVIKLFAALTIGCIVSLFLTNYIITAFFNVEMSILLITIGYSYLNFNYLLFANQRNASVTNINQ